MLACTLSFLLSQLFLQELARLGIDVVTVPRGGETTYHGPGQLVAYPILNLRQLGLGARAFVEGLEDAMVQTVGCFGIQVRCWDSLAGSGNARLPRYCVLGLRTHSVACASLATGWVACAGCFLLSGGPIAGRSGADGTLLCCGCVTMRHVAHKAVEGGLFKRRQTQHCAWPLARLFNATPQSAVTHSL